jgi:glycosyltransferase involved in cell wall biosynthesis
MAAGACLVVSDHAPNVEVVGDAAARFSLGDGAPDLARVLEELLDDPEYGAQLGVAAAARAADRYSWRRCADQYVELCERVCRH